MHSCVGTHCAARIGNVNIAFLLEIFVEVLHRKDLVTPYGSVVLNLKKIAPTTLNDSKTLLILIHCRFRCVWRIDPHTRLLYTLQMATSSLFTRCCGQSNLLNNISDCVRPNKSNQCGHTLIFRNNWCESVLDIGNRSGVGKWGVWNFFELCLCSLDWVKHNCGVWWYLRTRELSVWTGTKQHMIGILEFSVGAKSYGGKESFQRLFPNVVVIGVPCTSNVIDYIRVSNPEQC